MKNICHVIVGLGLGGAENMLYKLVKGTYKDYNIKIITLIEPGELKVKFDEIGVPVYSLGIKRGNISISAVKKVMKLIKDEDIIQTWMYHSDLLGALIKMRYPKKKLIWGIRHSDVSKDNNKRMTYYLMRINAALSKKPDVIISCSETAINNHVQIGYSSQKMRYIPNGFMVDEFKPYMKTDINYFPAGDVCQFITVGRWSPQKDYKNLFGALNILKKDGYLFNITMVGNGLINENNELRELIYDNGLKDNVRLVGPSNDVRKHLSDADIYVSSSLGEGFSNAIGEAMLTGLPVVATDVGDSKSIVGECGYIVKSRDSILLAKALVDMIKLDVEEYRKLSYSSINKIIKEYGIDYVVNEYKKLYKELV